MFTLLSGEPARRRRRAPCNKHHPGMSAAIMKQRHLISSPGGGRLRHRSEVWTGGGRGGGEWWLIPAANLSALCRVIAVKTSLSIWLAHAVVNRYENHNSRRKINANFHFFFLNTSKQKFTLCSSIHLPLPLHPNCQTAVNTVEWIMKGDEGPFWLHNARGKFRWWRTQKISDCMFGFNSGKRCRGEQPLSHLIRNFPIRKVRQRKEEELEKNTWKPISPFSTPALSSCRGTNPSCQKVKAESPI